MKQQSTITSKFLNRGLILRKDQDSLEPGEYYELLNMQSVQEGAMTLRLGNADLAPTLAASLWPNTSGNRLHTITKLTLSPDNTQNPRYIGYANLIYRTTPQVSGEYTSAVSIALDGSEVAGTPPVPNPQPYLQTNERWGSAVYNTGTQGQSSQYFATSRGLARHDGGTGKLQLWGVPAPLAPAVAVVGAASIVNVLTPNSGPFRIEIQITGSTPISVIGTAGYYRYSYNVVSGQPPAENMILYNGSETIQVAAIDPASNSFFAYTNTAKTGVWYDRGTSLQPSTAGVVQQTVSFFAAKNLSLNGDPEDQFDTVDPVYISIYVDQPQIIQDLRIRLGVGETADPAGNPTDFYETVVTPSTIAPVVTAATDPANQANVYDYAQQRADLVNQGIVGDFINENDYLLQQTRPQELPPTISGEPVWVQIGPQKREFVTVGKAGQPGFDWRSITSVTIIARSQNASITTPFNVALGNVAAVGGGGPDASQPGYFPYNYLYRYRNAKSNAPGNPCVDQPDNSGVIPKRRSVIVQVRGTETAVAGQPQRDDLYGAGTLQVFRRGGLYSDGLYRLVKNHFNPLTITGTISGTTLTKTSNANWEFASFLVGASVQYTNGGVPRSTTITAILSGQQVQLADADAFTGVIQIGTIVIDDTADEDILGAEVMEFDNDQPVTSTLKQAVSGVIGAFLFGGGGIGINRITVGSQRGDAPAVRIGSIINIGSGSNYEQARIIFIYGNNPLDIEVYFQKTHTVGEQIEVNAAAGQPCTLTCIVGDAAFIAGDPNNEGLLYKSKQGNPEAFPIVNQITRNLNIVQVTAPSQKLVEITEWNGEVCALTSVGIKTVRIWNGDITPPQDTPANRGLMDRRCYAKGDNRLWYLSYDGIYAWTGGQSLKISEAVNWIFQGRTVNGIPPLDYDNLIFACMEYAQNTLYFSYLAQNGLFYRLRYETMFDRWHLDITNSTAGNTDVITAYYRELDTGDLLGARLNSDAPSRFQFIQELASGTVGSSDTFPITDATGLAGNAIKFSLATPAFTNGSPETQKLFTQVILELSNPDSDVAVVPYYDFSSAPGGDSFVIPAQRGTCTVTGTACARNTGILFTADMVGSAIRFADGSLNVITAFVNANAVTLQTAQTFTGTFYLLRRRRVPLPLDQTTIVGQTLGREAYAISYQISGEGRIAPTFNSLVFDFAPLSEIQRGKNVDWDDLGYPYDKWLKTLSIEYNMNGQDVQMYLDTISGIDGETQTLGVMQFTLGGTGTGRSKANIPVVSQSTDRIICKMIRLRPAVQGTNIQIFDFNFEFEQYPADITRFTDPSDYGKPWEKYFNQLVMEVDTGGVAAQVFIFIDGSGTPAQGLTVTSTNTDRMRLLTLRNGIQGRMARLAVIPGVGGKFQLFKHDFVTTPADKGPVTHTYDWDDLGHPDDKRMYHMTFEYEVTNTMQVQLSGTVGIGNSQVPQNITTFTLTPGGRKEVTYQFPINSVYKLIRLQPTLTDPLTDAKIYVPKWQFEKYPPDIVPYTEPSNWGSPYQKYFQQLNLDVDTGGVNATVQVEIDGNIVQSLTVNTTALNRLVNLTLLGNLLGRQARIINTAGVGGKFQLFNHEFITLPADKGPVLHTYDWTNNGHPYDKRFYEVAFEYEVSAPMNMVLEGRSGIGGNQTTTVITTLALTPGGRNMQNYAFPNNSVYKQVRLRPEAGVPPEGARIYQPVFQAENYPPDVVPFTEPADYGTPYDKYFNQLDLDVDTGGVAATVQVEIDGAVVQTLQVTTTQYDRKRNLTLLPQLRGKLGRIVNTAGPGGKFQLFNQTFIVVPADAGPVVHSFDWDNLGHPYDKRLKSVTLEYDPDGVNGVNMLMDTITGNDGTIITLDALTFPLAGSDRSLQTFPIPDGTVVKMIRFHPQTTGVNWKHWKYTFDFERMPQDTLLFTEFDDLGYPCEKILRSINIDADTGGVTADLNLEVDGQISHTFQVQTTEFDRTRVLTPPSNIIGFRFRMKPVPGPGGKFQLFKYQYDRLLEPCRVNRWDSYEQSFGSNGYKFIKQVWLEYTSTCPLAMFIYRDDGELFHVEPLPAHDTRAVYRFFVPKAGDPSVVGVEKRYNKSKIYRFVMVADNTDGWFKFYRDASRVETLNTGQDQRAGYQQHYLFTQMPIPV